MVNTMQKGIIHHRTIKGMSQMEYFVYIPESHLGSSKILYTIHGVSRNAKEHIQGLIAQAERNGAILIAPLFAKEHFPRYQQLGTNVQQERADMAFDHLLQDAHEWLGTAPAPMRMFGFSGGGQFVHRYAMFYPKRVAKMVLAAPGWYTFPDPERRYPYGLKSTNDWPQLSFSLEKFLSIPTLVITGEQDDLRDKDLNMAREIDSFQGLNRIERAERWVGANRNLARSYDIVADFRQESVPNAGHAYESYLAHPPFAEVIFDFLFEDQK
ncbi:MAG: alpha/beta fold hydrolase [Desulfuromonadales bacterium]